jgi:hypothetical protein
MEELNFEGRYVKSGFAHFSTKTWAALGFKIEPCRDFDPPEVEEFASFLWNASFCDGERTLRILRSRSQDDVAMAEISDEKRPNPDEHHMVSEKEAVEWFGRVSKIFYERVLNSPLRSNLDIE